MSLIEAGKSGNSELFVRADGLYDGNVTSVYPNGEAFEVEAHLASGGKKLLFARTSNMGRVKELVGGKVILTKAPMQMISEPPAPGSWILFARELPPPQEGFKPIADLWIDEVALQSAQDELADGSADEQVIEGSELVIPLADCVRFLDSFCGIQRADHCSAFERAAEAAPDHSGNHWPLLDHPDLTYERLVDVVRRRQIKQTDDRWVHAVYRSFDVRQPASRVLHTRAGFSARLVFPQLRRLPYSTLWAEYKDVIPTAREQLAWLLLIYWKTDGAVFLDPHKSKDWTRTGSMTRGGSGMHVSGSHKRGIVVHVGSDPNSAARHGSSRLVIAE